MSLSSLFNRKSVKATTPLEQLQTRSATSMDTLRTTIEELKETNKAIAVEFAKNEARIAKLSAANIALDSLKGTNSKVISNFESSIG